ncbi:MAG: hypothetical protein J5I59_05635 [Saprospiraceae bacterium]|nr:hypothetical protein [Saprospiraceae bacterium]
MIKIIFKILIICILLGSSNYLNGQAFSMNGGIRPNNLLGSHIGFMVKMNVRKKVSLGLDYRLVKYVDNFYDNKNEPEPGFHKEYVKDKTFIDFPELDRGYVFGDDSEDWRIRDLYHSFSLYVGYDFFRNKHFLVSGYLGPHISFSRTTNYYHYVPAARVKITKESEELELPYFDYSVARIWDVGIGSRVDAEYFLFKNLSAGIHASFTMDVLIEGIDFVYGGVITFHF